MRAEIAIATSEIDRWIISLLNTLSRDVDRFIRYSLQTAALLPELLTLTLATGISA